MQFFSVVAATLMVAALALGWPLLTEYLRTGLVPRLPTAILAMGLTILGFVSIVAGLILDTVTVGRREMKRLAILRDATLPGPDEGRRWRTPVARPAVDLPLRIQATALGERTLIVDGREVALWRLVEGGASTLVVLDIEDSG